MTNTPTPKMLRECANILETAPHDRQMTAAWLREQADKQELAQKTARAVRVALHRIAQDIEVNR